MMGIMVPETCCANNKFCNKEPSVASSWPFCFHVLTTMHGQTHIKFTLYTTFICSTTPLQEPQILQWTALFIISQLFNDSVNDWMDHQTITEAWILKNTHWALQFSGCNYCFIFGRSRVQISVPRLAILTEACYSSQPSHENVRASPQIMEPCLHFPFFPTKYSSSYQLTPQSAL